MNEWLVLLSLESRAEIVGQVQGRKEGLLFVC